MRELYMKNGDGFLLVYSVDNRTSFNELKSIRESILRVKGTDKVPIMVVGNKCDLESNRKVQAEEGEKLVKEWDGPVEFLESSAKTLQNVTQVFINLVIRISQLRGDIEPDTTPEVVESSTSSSLVREKPAPKKERRRCTLI
eukprot:TRINITY_DN261_c0_g1_i1.p1 TRINITY_DN261_c0_g1~~TRINITY_DN261_c0_g1_i1.p1  ORF type:complete len:142 (-),score=28.34 TRINITY_DN261_c0_g1_i1:42-467(-)